MSLGRLFTPVRQLVSANLSRNRTFCCTSFRLQNVTSETPEKAQNQPVSYLNSPAASWKGRHSRTGTDQEMLWYQPYVIVTSMAAFMLYFFVLREENDLDEMLYKPLYTAMPEMERQEIETYLKNAKPDDKLIPKMKKRLEEVNAILEKEYKQKEENSTK